MQPTVNIPNDSVWKLQPVKVMAQAGFCQRIAKIGITKPL